MPFCTRLLELTRLMASQATTLGGFLAELMNKQQHTNRSLATVAEVSEGAIRNLLKVGRSSDAKDPDPRTLRQVADALDVDPMTLFRLAGYMPPQPDAHTVRAEYVADLFDRLTLDKQDAVLALLEAMITEPRDKTAIIEMRRQSHDALAGIDLAFPGVLRVVANDLVVRYAMRDPADVERIAPDAEVLQNKWQALPPDTRERIKALIRHKLSLNYDPTMVETEWRK